MRMFHGSPELFGRFDLSRAGVGTGIKYGFGVYLTESERSAVHFRLSAFAIKEGHPAAMNPVEEQGKFAPFYSTFGRLTEKMC